MLSVDIIQEILEYINDLKTQLNLTELSNDCYNYLKIKQMSRKDLYQEIFQERVVHIP